MMAGSKQEVLEWENVSIIGKGGSSTVYKAISKPLGEHIAVKQIDIDGMTKEQMSGIRAEIDTMKSLSHPNIVSYMGMQLRPNKVYILMEFASLGSLRHHYQRIGPFSEKHVRYCLEHIVNGLQYLHSNGIAHRDVKCANCLISNSGVVKLADFGASKRFESQSIVSGLKGTPHWMAPEVIKGTQMTTGWMQADVWSLGCTVVEMYTGKVPYAEYENPMTAMYKIANGERPSLQRKNSPEVVPSSELASFVRLCCAVDPTERPSLQVLAGQAFLSLCSAGSASLCLTSAEIQSFFAPVNSSSSSSSESAAAGMLEHSPGGPMVIDTVMTDEEVHEEVQHSEMFSPDPAEAAAAQLMFSSVDTFATLKNSGGGRKLRGVVDEVQEEEEQQYEDDWSADGELNNEREEQEEGEGLLSRCVTRQAHSSSPAAPPAASPTAVAGKRLELQPPSSVGVSSCSSAVSLDFGELPTPLMGGASRKTLVRYDSDVSIGERESVDWRRGAAGGGGAVKGFEVSSSLISELQQSSVLSFDEANQVYLSMMNKYGSGASAAGGAGGEGSSSTYRPSDDAPLTSTASDAPAAVVSAAAPPSSVSVVPNLSPVKVKSQTSSAAASKEPVASVDVPSNCASSAAVKQTASDLKFGFSSSSSSSSTPSSSTSASSSGDKPTSNRGSAIPVLLKDNRSKEPVVTNEADSLVRSPPSDVVNKSNRNSSSGRPNAPFSGEKLRIHNCSHNNAPPPVKDLRGVPQEKLSGAALRKKAAQELQEAQQAGKQHPHQQALLKIKPSHHVHTGSSHHHSSSGSSSTHKPPSKRARHEKPSDGSYSTLHHSGKVVVDKEGNSSLNIEEVVRDLQNASQNSKTLRGQQAALGASLGSTARSHSAGVTSESLSGGLGTPQHRNRLPPVVHNADHSAEGAGGGAAPPTSSSVNALGARYIQSAPAVSRSMNLPPIKETLGSKTPKLKPTGNGRLYNTGLSPAASSLGGRVSPGTMMHSTSSVEFLGIKEE